MSSKKKYSSKKSKKKVETKLNLAEFKTTMRRDFKEVKEFYLDEERIGRLNRMGRLKRWFFMAIWLIKSLFLKLTPIRRLLLIIGVFLITPMVSSIKIGFIYVQFDHLRIFGSLILLFILMLELKDKLLARDELIAGRSVQLALMPKSSPEIPGWDIWLYSRPANDVGGDLVDYLKLDSKRFSLALGDVAGKGLAAALFMAKLQATIRTLATECDSIPDLGAKINEIFHRDSMPKSFASLVYIVLNSDSGDLSFLNAGHLPPLFMRKNHVEQMFKGDVALGLLAQTQYHLTEIELQKDEFLFVYSDGITEAQNEAGDFFGQNKLEDILPELSSHSAREVGEKIIEEVNSFVQEARPHDDLSLIVLKRC